MKFEVYGNADNMEALMAPAAEFWKTLRTNPAYEGVLGWMDCNEATEGYLQAVLDKAAQWRKMADTLIVVGVGGSNQAARGVIDALGAKDIQVVWAGNTLSAWELSKTLQALEGHSVVMHVIAKNFETLEPGSHYRMLRKWMEARYTPEEMAERVVLTGTEGSRLHEIAK